MSEAAAATAGAEAAAPAGGKKAGLVIGLTLAGALAGGLAASLVVAPKIIDSNAPLATPRPPRRRPTAPAPGVMKAGKLTGAGVPRQGRARRN